jgi:hypothetical protein
MIKDIFYMLLAGLLAVIVALAFVTLYALPVMIILVFVKWLFF